MKWLHLQKLLDHMSTLQHGGRKDRRQADIHMEKMRKGVEKKVKKKFYYKGDTLADHKVLGNIFK